MKEKSTLGDPFVFSYLLKTLLLTLGEEQAVFLHLHASAPL